MILMTYAAWGLLGFTVAMLGMTAWLDRPQRGRVTGPNGGFKPDAAEAWADDRHGR